MDVSETPGEAELKDPPVDGDGVPVTDSAAGNATKRVLWSRKTEAAASGDSICCTPRRATRTQKAQITDFPASPPANGGNAATVAG